MTQYRSTRNDDQTRQSSLTSYASQLKTSALRLTCIARLIELYEIPGGLEEAVEVLESIATFYGENAECTNNPNKKENNA